MGRLSSLCAPLLAGGVILGWAGSAHALCAIAEANYTGGASGAYAVTAAPCEPLAANGGGGFTTASASSVVTDPNTNQNYSLSSSANLTTGVLTADSQKYFASSSIWDTFTYTGLPSGGTEITATLTLSGTLGGLSELSAMLEAGPASSFPAGDSTNTLFVNASTLPASISLTFDVQNGVAETVFAEIQVNGDGAGGVADFSDPPSLSLTLPAGADVTTVGGFDNFSVGAPVPEPTTWALLLMGFTGLALAGRRRAKVAAA